MSFAMFLILRPVIEIYLEKCSYNTYKARNLLYLHLQNIEASAKMYPKAGEASKLPHFKRKGFTISQKVQSTLFRGDLMGRISKREITMFVASCCCFHSF